MSELQKVEGNLLDSVSPAMKGLAKTCFEFFSDKPVSQAIDAATMVKKLALRFAQMEATEAEIMEAANRLDLRLEFRPSSAEIIAEINAIREETKAREFRDRYNGSKMMVDVRGIEVLVKAEDIQAMLDQGWVLPAPKARSADEVRALLRVVEAKPMPRVEQDNSRQMEAIEELRRRR